MKILITLLTAMLSAAPLLAVELKGEPVQGGLIFGQTEAGTLVSLDTTDVPVSIDGHFVIGFGRDETGTRTLKLVSVDGNVETIELPVAARQYKLERVDGLPQRTVTPDPSATERIRAEGRMVSNARLQIRLRSDYANGFAWPALGRISGEYGSQRILNGEPGRPHYGLDVAAPEGTLVRAPADGVITLTHPDMYFSGGTIILDHGQGLSSTFLHLSKVLVEAGQTVERGDPIARIGSTGRASGPHLDWRMNWQNRRVDPRQLVSDMAEAIRLRDQPTN
jgi:murein DD-endopeptidase MepM/ murein hydrolase activator NlpD